MANIKLIYAELEVLEESAMFSGQSQFEQAKFWRGINLLIGAPAALFAAIAGVTGLASVSNQKMAAYFALAAAGLGALVTALNADRRSTQAHSAANAYLEIQTAARQLRLVDLDEMKYKEARASLRDLTNRRDEINKTADIPSFYAYLRGRMNIKKNRQKYGTGVDKNG
jgi:hypothetical protein